MSAFYFQNGDHKLTFHIYRLSFLNFLLGKQPNGPGQYIFGTVRIGCSGVVWWKWFDINSFLFFQVTPQTPTCMFPIDYSAMNSTEEDLEPYRPDKLLEKKGSRRSVLVWYLFKQNHLLTKRNRGQKLLKKQHIKNHVIVLILTF